MKFFTKKIYMDNAGSTPVDPQVKKEMHRVGAFFANPSSIHKMGVLSHNEILKSREKIAKILKSHSDEIIFTGSATESIALAIIGTINNYHKKNENIKYTPHIITTNIEHKAVLENFKMLSDRGLVEVSYLEVDNSGVLPIKNLKENLKENTILVSIGYANNEIGIIQNIEEIAKEIRRVKKKKNFTKNEESYPFLHTDATQAINYLFIKNVDKLGVDMMSFNGAKIYGPKGIGVLYKKRNIKLDSLYKGGGQEFNLRPGTESIENIVGLAKALEIVEEIKDVESIRLKKLRDIFILKIKDLSKETGFDILINGDEENRLPNNVNISIKNISNELVLIELDAKGIFISTKSACSAGDEDVSHVISAIRKNDLDSLRFSFGRYTKEKDILYTIDVLRKILLKYKNML